MRRKNAGFFPFVDMGVDVFVDQALERFLDFAVFVRELHVFSGLITWKVISTMTG
jgi:hypothetical protein